MTLSALGIFSAAGAGGAAFSSDYELIETQILGSSQASITFSSLSTYSSTYKHLQVRMALRDTRAVTVQNAFIRFNADSGNNYAYHLLQGDGSSVSSTSGTSQDAAVASTYAGASAASNVYGGGVLDILDPYSTTKNTTTRSLSGFGSSTIRLWSGVWLNTAALTSMQIIAGAGANFVSGSRFSLYGIKG
jgi:hypothetical protein